ncbi:MAG: DNA-binding protein [Nitrospirota bacterium]
MKKIGMLTGLVFIIVFMLIVESSAQMMKWKGSGGWCRMDSPYMRLYNPNTVETITGEVVKIGMFYPVKRMTQGIHLVVKTEKEEISVHLGPAWYIQYQDIEIKPKDKVEVKGARVIFREKPIIIAAEIKRGEDILHLRDKNGFPFWSGWRRR